MSIPVVPETEQTRQKHIQELITTEETFTKDLSTVIEVENIQCPHNVIAISLWT
jgi:hypothetical protein